MVAEALPLSHPKLEHSSDFAFDEATRALAKLETHEAVCAERYRGLEKQGTDLFNRIDRLERVMLGATGVLLVGMLGMIMKLAPMLTK